MFERRPFHACAPHPRTSPKIKVALSPFFPLHRQPLPASTFLPYLRDSQGVGSRLRLTNSPCVQVCTTSRTTPFRRIPFCLCGVRVVLQKRRCRGTLYVPFRNGTSAAHWPPPRRVTNRDHDSSSPVAGRWPLATLSNHHAPTVHPSHLPLRGPF